MNNCPSRKSLDLICTCSTQEREVLQEPLLGWAEAALGRAQGRMKPHGRIHSLCLDHLYPPLQPGSDLGRGEREAPGLLGAAGSEQHLGNLRVPTRERRVTRRLLLLAGGRGAGDGFDLISKISVNRYERTSDFLPVSRVPTELCRVQPAAFRGSARHLRLAPLLLPPGSAPGFTPGSGLPPCVLGIRTRLGGSCSGSSAVPFPGVCSQTSPVPSGLLHDKVDVLVLPTCCTCPYDGVPYS